MTLPELIKRLEEAKGPDRELDARIWLETTLGATRSTSHIKSATNLWPPYDIDETRDPDGRLMTVPSFTSSVDAAIALAERVLPGRSIMMGWRQTSETQPWARVGLWSDPDATGKTPAIALTISILHALQAKGEQP